MCSWWRWPPASRRGAPPDALPTDATYWREGLLDLADGIPEAWQLVVEDVTKPAFMQHPWRSWEAEAGDYVGETKPRTDRVRPQGPLAG